jgi:hypothetical protein
MFAITKKKKLRPKSPPPGSPPAAVPARTVILPGLIAALFVRQHQRQCCCPCSPIGHCAAARSPVVARAPRHLAGRPEYFAARIFPAVIEGRESGWELHCAQQRIGQDGMGRERCTAFSCPCVRTGVADCPVARLRPKTVKVIPIPSTRSQRRKGASALSTPVRCGS